MNPFIVSFRMAGSENKVAVDGAFLVIVLHIVRAYQVYTDMWDSINKRGFFCCTEEVDIHHGREEI